MIRRYDMSRWAGMLAVMALCALAGACSSFTPYRSARPLAPGRTKMLVAPQINTAGPKEGFKAPFPEIAVGVRRGVTEDVELGGTLTVLPLGEVITELGIEGMVQRHVHRTSSGRVDVAVAAGAGYRYFRSSGAVFEMVNASVPVIMSIHLGENELILSPTVAWQRWVSTGARPIDIASVGMSIGYRWQFATRYALMPELGVASTPTEFAGRGKSALGHVGLALIIGRD